jgi:hypothetical protein
MQCLEVGLDWRQYLPAAVCVCVLASIAASPGLPIGSMHLIGCCHELCLPFSCLADVCVDCMPHACLPHGAAPCCRDVWRSVALAVNYGVYNEVATEALFSAQVGAVVWAQAHW